MRQTKSSGKLELFRASLIADYPDAENYLSLFNSVNFSTNGPKNTHYLNPGFDLLYQQSLILISDFIRIKKYKEINAMIMSDFPIIPLYYDQVIRFVQKNIEVMEINPINLLILKNVRKS